MNTYTPGYCSDGSIKKVKNGKHAGQFRYRFEYYEKGGAKKPIDRLAPTYDAAKQAMAKLKKVIQATHGGGLQGGTKSLHWLIDEWLADRKPHLAPSTYDNYTKNAKRAKKTWPNAALADCDYDLLKAYHTAKGRGADLALGILKAALDYAAKPSRGWIVYNPARELEALPYVAKKRRAIQPSYFLRLLHDGAADVAQRVTFFLMLVLGGRISEILALQRDDFNRQTGRLRIERQLAGPGEEETEDGTVQRLKSGSGMRLGLFEDVPARIVKLGPGAVAILTAYLDHLDAIGYAGPWLFPAPEGGPWDYSNWLKKVWKKSWSRANAKARAQAKETGVPFKVRTYVPHETRHSHISFRILLGDDPVTIGHEVGQGHLNITMKYAHVVQDIEEIEPEMLRKLLGRTPWVGDEIGDKALTA